MLKSLYNQHILRDPSEEEVAGSEAPPTRIEPVVSSTDKQPVVLKGGNDAPLPKEMENEEFSLSTFEVEQLPPQPPKKEEAKKEETVAKVEPKKVAPIVPPVKTAATAPKPIQPITPLNTKAAERDYSGFAPEEITVLKQMSNPAFEFATKLMKQNKELSGLKNSTYLQHERAYLLDPKYNEKQTELSYVRKEGQYWQQQLVLLRSAKDAREMTGWDAQGNMVFGNVIKPTVENEELLRSAMNNCMTAAAGIEGDLRSFPTQYKNQLSTDLKAIEDTNKQMFSWETDPKLLDYEMEVEGIGKRTIKQIREDFAEMLPPYMRSHPLVSVCGNLMASLRIGQAYLAEAQNKGAVAQIIADETEHKEPTSKQKQIKDGKNLKEVHGITEFSTAEFPM